MARASAINGVVDAIHTVLDVAAYRALCPGGIYRGAAPSRVPPWTDLAGAAETSWDTFGRLGSQVGVPVRVVTAGTHRDGDEQAATIIDKALALLSDRSVLTVAGWTICALTWAATEVGAEELPDGTTQYVTTARLIVYLQEAGV